MKCPKCNQEIEDNSVFCEYCGEKILTTEKESEKIVENVTADNVAKPWYKRKWVLFSGIAAAVIIIAVITLNSLPVKAIMGDYFAVDRMGWKCYDKGDYDKAFDYWVKGTELKRHDYALELGMAYLMNSDFNGLRYPEFANKEVYEVFSKELKRRGYKLPDVDNALYYLKQKDDEVHYPSLYRWLGDCYFFGNHPGYSPNGELAAWYYNKIIQIDSIGNGGDTYIKMAILYSEGRLVPQDSYLEKLYYKRYKDWCHTHNYDYPELERIYDSIKKNGISSETVAE